MVAARVGAGSSLLQGAAIEYGRAQMRATDSQIRRELEWLPVRHSAGQRLRRWGRELLGRREPMLAAAPVADRVKVEGTVGARVGVRRGASGALAAIPILEARERAEGAPAPLSALPGIARG